MRTSRISRETTRVVNALSIPDPLGSRQSLRRSTRSFNATTGSTSTQPEQSDSDLSTPPSSPDATSSVNASGPGKRKRGVAEPRPPTLKLPDTAPTSARRSPRKAPSETDAGTQQPRSQRKPAKRIKREDGSVEVVAPTNWQEMYAVTAAMRKRIPAPVDTMGCETLADRARSPRDQRLQTLVSLMLSSQTKDTVTAAAMRNLQAHLPGGFGLDALLAVAPETLNELIGKVGFHNNKTKFIKSVAEILRDRFEGDIPDTIDGLVSLPGVGPKMAYLCMSAAWGRDEGIGVDVHVHRITNLWKWHKTSTPEQTRAELEAWLPREKWHDINHLLVGLGQTICLPVGRRCGDCDLYARKLCPSAVPGSTKKSVKKEVVTQVESGEIVKKETVIENDDAGYAVNVKKEDIGEVNVSGALGHIPDIEGLGAGTVRKISSLAQNGR